MISHASDYAVSQIKSRIPSGNLALPSEIAGSVLYLLSDEARSINGSTFVIDGGMSACLF